MRTSHALSRVEAAPRKLRAMPGTHTRVNRCPGGFSRHPVQPDVRSPFLSDDQQSHVGYDIEDQKDDFEQPEERVHDYVEGFSGNWKAFALRTVHQIWCQYTHCRLEDQNGSVYDCAPHKECC